jgi:ribosome-associated toxin RatA of RatAB toxin-antitoxin module
VRFALSLLLALGLAGGAAADAVEVRMSARVAASPDRVLALLADFEAWDRVFTGIETRVAEQPGPHHARLRQRVQLMGRTMTYTLAVRVDAAARSVELALDPNEPNDVAELHSVWRVRPHADGGSTIELRVVTSSGLGVPAFVERRVTEGTTRASLDDLVRALDRVAADATETPTESG